MAPVWTNRSCDPFNGPNTPCTLGNYVRYAINVSTPADITAGLRFVKKHGIRLVVRNTGHDYIGKSTGAGALGIWTRHLKRIEYIGSYTSRASSWTGAAFKLGAGVQGFEAHEAAHARGVTVVAGECPTVGIAGGYSQGGGHSALASRYGLAADQVLEWEVVTADGKLLIANAVKNKDLYWALAGGGGGTYGVVVSMTVKAHPDEVTTTAKLSWTHDGSKKQVEAWWEAIDFFHQQTPSYTDHGVMILAICTGGFFSLGPFFGSGLTAAQTETMLAPVIAKLKQLELPYNLNITQYSGYLRAFNENFAYVEVGIAQYGGRLIPRKTVLEKRTEFQAAIRKIVEDGALVFEITTHPTLEIAGNPYNAVLPAWRDNELDLVIARQGSPSFLVS